MAKTIINTNPIKTARENPHLGGRSDGHKHQSKQPTRPRCERSSYLAVHHKTPELLGPRQLGSRRAVKREDELCIRPRRVRTARGQRARPFIAQALVAAERAGGMAQSSTASAAKGGSFGRGRAASLSGRARLMVIKSRVVRRGIPGRALLSAFAAIYDQRRVPSDWKKANKVGRARAPR